MSRCGSHSTVDLDAPTCATEAVPVTVVSPDTSEDEGRLLCTPKVGNPARDAHLYSGTLHLQRSEEVKPKRGGVMAGYGWWGFV